MSVAEAEPVTSCVNDQVVWPWQAEPYRLWSLLDMQPVMMATFAAAIGDVFSLRGQITVLSVAGLKRGTDGYRKVFDEVQQQAKDRLGSVHEELKSLPLSLTVRAQFDRLREAFKNDNSLDVLDALITEFVMNALGELTAPQFLMVEASKRHYYEQKTAPFGPEVESAFPLSARDIAAACRCFALDEWTACVFHLMRALESPLHKLADRVGVVFPTPLDLENWQNIVNTIESNVNAEVKRREQTKKVHNRNDELKVLGQAALQFRHFKNAWRNDAAHGREYYDEREATVVFDAVKVFMQHMASIV